MLVVPSDRLDEVTLYKVPGKPASLLVTFHSRKGVCCKSVVDAFKLIAYFEKPMGDMVFFIHPEKVDDTWRTKIQLSKSSARKCVCSYGDVNKIVQFVNDANFLSKFPGYGLVSGIDADLDEQEEIDRKETEWITHVFSDEGF
jgi:hypothetical protein